jgi:acyl-CoA synthetase (AMP-forming)/AMP-acid ligase II
LPNGLEFLVVFLALTRARLVAAPINPVETAEEMRFLIDVPQAKAVIAKNDNATVEQVTRALALPILTPQIRPSGVVTLPQLAPGSRRSPDAPKPEDVALLMYTSDRPAKRRPAYTPECALLSDQHCGSLCIETRRS